MKAIAECPKCKLIITTDCDDCIEYGESNCAQESNCNEKVKWKKVPETERELCGVEQK